MTNPAFDFLRKYKDCDENTEALVVKRTRGRITTSEMITVFERGVSGEYGKIYKVDPQLLLDWIDKYIRGKNKNTNYLETGLLNPSISITNINYHVDPRDWMKEVNKCYIAFLSGVSVENFHPDCYSVLTLDNKITFNLTRYGKFENDMYGNMNPKEAMQAGLRDYFSECREKGYNHIYLV